MRKINEIFYSLQGEGFHTGTPAVFVRFSGCNLKCSFCDTQHEEFRMMTDDEIIAEVCTYPCQMVILTGGEPGLSIDSQLTKALHAAGKYIAIETNGTCVLPEDIDWVTCSPKEGTTAKHHFLQPCSGQNTNHVIAYIKEHPQWRLSLQTHKLIDIP